MQTNTNMGDTVVPPELFGHIIDIIAENIPDITLTKEQFTTLGNCALVCKFFLPLCRKHLFRCAIFGFDGIGRQKQLEQLLDLLENQPAIRSCIREIIVQLESYTWPPVAKPRLERGIQILTSLPNVHKITTLYSSYRIRVLSSQHDIGSFCNRLIEGYAAKGTLRTLNAKKLSELPFSAVSSCKSLTTLSLDRCELHTIEDPIPTVRTLTLRKISVPISFLSYFPNLEELNIIRSELKNCNKSVGLPAPSFGIQRLSLEWHSMGDDDDPSPHVNGTEVLLDYFKDKAFMEDTLAFGQLTALDLVLDEDVDLAQVVPLFKNMRALQNFAFATSPGVPIEITTLGLVNHLRHQGLSVTLQCRAHLPAITDSYTRRFVPHLPFIQSVASLQEHRISLDTLLEHSAFTPSITEDDTQTSSASEMTPWSRVISVLEHHSEFKTLKEVEIQILVDHTIHPGHSQFIPTDIGSDISTGGAAMLADKIANMKGFILGTYLHHFNQCGWSKAEILFFMDT